MICCFSYDGKPGASRLRASYWTQLTDITLIVVKEDLLSLTHDVIRGCETRWKSLLYIDTLVGCSHILEIHQY